MIFAVTGWGRLSEGGTLPSVLQEVQVPIVSNDRCKMMFLRAGRHEFIPDIFLCAGHDVGGQFDNIYLFILDHYYSQLSLVVITKRFFKRSLQISQQV